MGVISKHLLDSLKLQSGGVRYVRQCKCRKVLTIKWKCLKIHLLIFCVIDSQAECFPNSYDTQTPPLRHSLQGKTNSRNYLNYLLMKVCCWCCTNRSQVLYLWILIAVLLLYLLIFNTTPCSTTLQVSFWSGFISLSVGGWKRNVLKCLWGGVRPPVLWASLRSFWGCRCCSDPRTTVHECFGF